MFRKIVFYVIVLLSFILIFASLLSLIYDIPKWYLKVLDFPRLQQLVVAIILLITFIIINKKWKIYSLALSIGLITAIIIHSSFIFPYVLASPVIPTAKNSSTSFENKISIMLTNVLMTNKNNDKLLEIIKAANPDLILAMEVNDWWISQLQSLEKEYPYMLKYSLDNAYGMSLYSKFPLKETEVQFLNHSKVPSFTTIISLASGKEIKFYGVHPVAPFPSDKYPTNIGKSNENEQEEIELLKVGKAVIKDTIPVIVAGDFNDVSWSNTTRLFGEDCNIKDVRIGRGLNNTFDATSSFMRWPLDHFFVSDDFSVLNFKRLDSFGSDHFPLLGEFVIEE